MNVISNTELFISSPSSIKIVNSVARYIYHLRLLDSGEYKTLGKKRPNRK